MITDQPQINANVYSPDAYNPLLKTLFFRSTILWVRDPQIPKLVNLRLEIGSEKQLLAYLKKMKICLLFL
jgi:hypothetical protein